MQENFSSPKSKEEFIKKAEIIEVDAAKAMIEALEHRQKAAAAVYDKELEFYTKVIQYKNGELDENLNVKTSEVQA